MMTKLKPKKQPLRALALAAMIAVSSNAAHAQGYPVMDVLVETGVQTLNATMATMSAAVTGFITSFWTWANTILLPALKGQAQTIAESQIAATQNAMSAHTAMTASMESQAIDNRYVISDPCSIGAMAGGADAIRSAPPVGAGAGRRSGGGTGGSQITRAKTPLGQALKISVGSSPVPTPEVSATVGAAAGCDAFASGTRANECNVASLTANSSNGYPDADVRASTVINGPQKANTNVVGMSINMDANSAEEMAVKAFRRNLDINSNEPRNLTVAELKTEAGRRYLGLRDEYDARMSLASAPMDRQIAMHASSTGTIQALNDMVASSTDATFVTDYLGKYKTDWATKGVSSDEMLNIDVNRRYYNLQWMSSIAQMDEAEIQREQLRQAALNNVLVLRLEQQERVNGLVLGGLLAAATRQEMTGTLNAAHQAAAR